MLNELGKFLDDAIVVGLRENDRLRTIVIAVDVPTACRLPRSASTTPHMIGPVGALPMQRPRDQVIVIGRGDAIAGAGELRERGQDRGTGGFQAAEMLLEEGAVGAAGRAAQLRLNGVGGVQPVGDLVGGQQRRARRHPTVFRPPQCCFAASAKPVFDQLRPPRRRAARRRARNAGAADDQRPPRGDRGLQFSWRTSAIARFLAGSCGPNYSPSTRIQSGLCARGPRCNGAHDCFGRATLRPRAGEGGRQSRPDEGLSRLPSPYPLPQGERGVVTAKTSCTSAGAG